MSDFRLEKQEFIIEDYDKKAPFCSFLPGLAGLEGIPVWSFYVNRGQGMTGFGIQDKQKPIMELFPANIAYENTAVKGFRTFVKKDGKYFEPFFDAVAENVKRTMYIKQNSFKVVEVDNKNNFQTSVTYYIMPYENYGAVVRDVTFKNLDDTAEFEILDGMPKVIPYGVTAEFFQRMANLFRSYNTLINYENKIPVILNPITGDDEDEVGHRTGGHFYLSFDKSGLVAPIYDPIAIFGDDTSLVKPVNFIKNGLSGVTSYNQHSTNKICGCFTPVKATFSKGEEYRLSTLVGFTHSSEFITEKAKEIVSPGYLDEKFAAANGITDKLTEDIATSSGEKVMDMYFRQCYLDNFLRGGYPFSFGDGKIVHLYSRKHGDPERDYNHFVVSAEFYSQGDGNYRDVCQNRRNDVLFHPECGEFNIHTFFSMMQFDGYNPLFVKGTTFSLKAENKEKCSEIVEKYVLSNKPAVEKILNSSFTAGKLINGIVNNKAELSIGYDEFLDKILELCAQNIETASDKYGYWSDHWNYNMDLVDNYLKVFPDRLSQLLFDNNEYTYFESDVFVRPRAEKYVFNGKDARQYGAYYLDRSKYERGYDPKGSNWLSTNSGKIYKTNLMEKLLSLCINKFALLDPAGMGIEMEAGRVGWNDSTNGLPGTFGSGMSETFELKRILKFTKKCCERFKEKSIKIPVELSNYIADVSAVLAKNLSDFDHWDSVAAIREEFRAKTFSGIDGKTCEVVLGELVKTLDNFIAKVDSGIKKAVEFGGGFCPTYLKYKATKFDILDTKSGEYNNIKVYEFEPEPVARFLEGPVKYLLDVHDVDKAEKIANDIKNSDIYDKKLKMYKTCESLENETFEFGRIRAFTPGWQERESIFLHMAYKYSLSVLEAGLYDAFYSELKNVFIPFLDPAVYGRSILENCSFLASSVNPDETLHGRGFVARLSGSTAEALSIWAEMYLGRAPFVYENGQLGLCIKPILAEWMFDDNGEITFKAFGSSTVTLHNNTGKATYDADVKINRVVVNGVETAGDTVFGKPAEKVRSGESAKIDIYFE